MKTKNVVLNYHDLSLVHETQKILPISDAMYDKGKKCSGGVSLRKKITRRTTGARGCYFISIRMNVLFYLELSQGYLVLSLSLSVYFGLFLSILVYFGLS